MYFASLFTQTFLIKDCKVFVLIYLRVRQKRETDRHKLHPPVCSPSTGDRCCWTDLVPRDATGSQANTTAS